MLGSKNLQLGEVLKYENPSFPLIVWDRNLEAEVALVKHDDIVIVVGDHGSGSIKIMTACGKKGWIYYMPRFLLKMEHVSSLGVEF